MTRADSHVDIARRRLEQLAASFDATAPAPVVDEETEPPRHSHRRDMRQMRAVAVGLSAALVVVLWWLLSGRPSTSEPVNVVSSSASPAAPGPVTSSAPEVGQVVVDVVGKVRKPGIVTLAAGSRVFEAVKAAGGTRGRVNLYGLNMARVLADGEQIVVGIEPPLASASGTETLPSSGLININTATAEQLQALPGVGPVTAQSIISWRETNGRFAGVDDLLDVKGIGPATLDSLRDLVTL